MRDIDEEVVRRKRDPRRESSMPPGPHDDDDAVDLSTLQVASLPPSPASAEPEQPAEPTKPEDPAPSRTARVVTNTDPRLDELEPLLRAGDWDAVLRALGPDDQAGRLPPNLGLVYAIARREKEAGEAEGARSGEPKKTDATDLAIRCTAGLLGVAPESALALVVAKRLLRRNPVAWQQRPAPPASVSALIMIAALAIGSALGWLVASGHVRFVF